MYSKKIATVVTVISSFAFLVIFSNNTNDTEICEQSEFKLQSMKNCHKLLNCNDLKDLKLYSLIGYGAVKGVYKAIWKNLTVAVSILTNEKYHSDFVHNLKMLKKYQGNNLITKLVGYCQEKNLILTEYHKNGNGINIVKMVGTNVVNRLKLCLNYAKILEMLHNKTTTTTINCDTNNLNKTLSQLLVTDDFQLILNDVDSLAEMENNRLVKCGSKEITGDFVAPEQLWPFKNEPFNYGKMKGYNEKTDIWKAASLCNYFLGEVTNSVTVRYRLFNLHKTCKSKDPNERPNASYLVKEYSRVISELDGDWL